MLKHAAASSQFNMKRFKKKENRWERSPTNLRNPAHTQQALLPQLFHLTIPDSVLINHMKMRNDPVNYNNAYHQVDKS